MRFKNLYTKKKLKNSLNLWYNLKKNYFNSFYLNFFFKYFLIFNFNSFNSVNLNFFKPVFNFLDMSLFKINNFSKFFFLNLLRKKTMYNNLGNFFFINFLTFYSKIDFLSSINSLNQNNLTFRFNYIFLNLGYNIVQNFSFFKKKKIDSFFAKSRLKLFTLFLKFILRYYFNLILRILFNYLSIFEKLFRVLLAKYAFNFFNLLNVNNTPVK